MQKKETTERDGNSDTVTRKIERTMNDGSKSVVVDRGTKDVFNIFSGSRVSVTRTDTKGNSRTKKF